MLSIYACKCKHCLFCYCQHICRQYFYESFVIYDTAMILLFPRVYYCYDSLIYDCFIISFSSYITSGQNYDRSRYKQVAAQFRVYCNNSGHS